MPSGGFAFGQSTSSSSNTASAAPTFAFSGSNKPAGAPAAASQPTTGFSFQANTTPKQGATKRGRDGRSSVIFSADFNHCLRFSYNQGNRLVYPLSTVNCAWGDILTKEIRLLYPLSTVNCALGDISKSHACDNAFQWPVKAALEVDTITIWLK